MNSSELFNFNETIENDITYYIIPKGTVLYHGSNTISTPEQLLEKRHTFFALTNEYASKYAKETGNVFKFETNTEIRLIAIDKPNETLYMNASDKIQNILDENYGFHNDHKRKSIPGKDNALSMYLCENRYDGYAANHMVGVSKLGDDDLDPEVIICDKQNLKSIEFIQNKADAGPPQVERRKKRRQEVVEPETPTTNGPGLFGDDDESEDDEKGTGLFGFNTPTKGGKKSKKNIQNVYKNTPMKRPVRAEDGTYTVKGKKYKELFGSREQVNNGTAYKTKAGLTKDDILMNKWGRLVSAKKHKTAKKEMRLEKHGYSAKKGKFGYVKKNSNTRKKRKEKKD
tara:strand:- start:65 stop:1090 length:1026 start_codon:yes stop_codon:yes gene_type:complete